MRTDVPNQRPQVRFLSKQRICPSARVSVMLNAVVNCQIEPTGIIQQFNTLPILYVMGCLDLKIFFDVRAVIIHQLQG